MMTVLGVSAAIWGLVMAVSPMLQIRRMLARRSSADVSIGYYGLLLPGFALWVAYGLSRSDYALVIPNIVAFLIGTTTVVTALTLRRRTPAVAD
jgi:uncharacterized protein with PQ loop repeat